MLEKLYKLFLAYTKLNVMPFTMVFNHYATFYIFIKLTLASSSNTQLKKYILEKNK